MATRSGAPYQQTQAQSNVRMEQNFESLMKSLNDQMTRLNQNLTDQLAQTNQNLTDQITHITARLDRLEAHTPGGNHEVQNELEPEFEFETPINPRRTLHQDHFFEPNPRRPNPDRVHDPNPRIAHHDPVYEPNPRRHNQDQTDHDERTLRSIRLEAPTFDGNLDPKVYID